LPSVLVIEEEPAILSVIARFLKESYSVEATCSGSDGLRRMSRKDYDVVLCDLHMTGPDGPEIYQLIRMERPELISRFVFMSGGAYTPRTEAFVDEMKTENIEVLAKPFSHSKLLAAIDDVLASHQTQKA